MGSVAITGRRPESLPWGYDEYDARAIELKNRLRYTISGLVEDGYTTYYIGMARGVDTYVAEILIELARDFGYKNIEIVACIPYKGFADNWDSASRQRYYDILGATTKVIELKDEYDNRAIFLRNKYMVDNSDIVLAVYDNVQNGGTYNTLMYAHEIGKKIIVEEI